MKNTIITACFAALLVSSCETAKDTKGSDKSDMPPGLSLSNMDTTVSPKEDFYQFANGQWLEKTEIPGDQGRWGGFGELSEKNNKMVLEIMTNSAQSEKFKDGTDEKKAIDFFSVGMDSMLAENVGTQPLQKWMDKINAADNNEALKELLPELHRSGYSPFFGASSLANLKDSKVNSLYVGAGGLGLPNRDYYTKTDEKSKEIRKKYIDHIARMLELGNIEGDLQQKAQDIFDLENRLALASLTPIESRNIPLLYNPMTIKGLQEMASTIDWDSYFNTIGVDMSRVDSVIVTQPKFVKEVNDVFQDVNPETIQDYFKWNVINQAANYLNNQMVEANFDFYGKTLRGTDEMRARWKRVLGSTNSVIGEAIGKVYVAETFPPEAKASAEAMVENLLKAFEGRINNLEWMTDSTKKQALNKLNNLTVKIGYPDEWKDYSGLEVASSGELYSYFGNMENAWKYQFDDNIEKVGEPVDKKEWGMNPQTVNAYFNPLNNEIVFPAAILQPPFYNYTADAAVNYGGMGAVIGHEISHGFDDQGSRFDATGNLVNWWSETDKEQFEARTGKLVAQFDNYEAMDSVNVQGKLTLGENIGDLGGLNAAYDALQIHLNENGNPGLIDGFTPEQRFFISWATIWRTKYKDEALRNQIMTDPHSPGMFRAIGPLENMETFYQAFDIKEGDPLYKPMADRVIIW